MSNYTLAAIESGLITARYKKEMCFWDQAADAFRDVLDLASKAMDELDKFSDEEKSAIFKAFDESVHSIAFSYYVDDEYATAIDLLERGEPDLLKSKVLLALCCWKIGRNLDDASQRKHYLSKAFSLAEDALRHQEDALWQEDPDSMDTALMVTGYLFLADAYRLGASGTKDLEKSLETIEHALLHVEDEDQKSSLLQVKSRYHRGFFGGLEFR
ncbi:MAG: hypothetical protein E7446_04235 [Ruminococcaceae bacterium]|nr:hypothetical protein [Oscillospiraceae bacterium]